MSISVGGNFPDAFRGNWIRPWLIRLEAIFRVALLNISELFRLSVLWSGWLRGWQRRQWWVQ